MVSAVGLAAEFFQRQSNGGVVRQPDYRPDTWVGTLVVILTIGLIGIGLVQPVLAEIAGFVRLDPWPAISLASDQIQFGLLLGLGALAGLAVSLEKVTAVGLASLGWIWLGAFGLFATAFESSNACASGLRWLLACGGFALSLLIACRPWLIDWWRAAIGELAFSRRLLWTKFNKLIRFTSG